MLAHYTKVIYGKFKKIDFSREWQQKIAEIFLQKNLEHETELRLVIAGDDPSGVAEEISLIDRWEKYFFYDAGTRQIQDVYFDTPAGALVRENFGVRIRDMDGDIFITIKGKPELLKNGSVRRLEMEQPWGEPALRMIVEFFRDQRIPVPPEISDWKGQAPSRIFEGAGLRVIHERKNNRRIKNISFASEPENVVVEMAIDEMVFPAGGIELKLFEIELEQKSSAGSEVIADLKKYFLKNFPDVILPWPYSKLATGVVLQNLSREKNFRETLDDKNQLRKSSYEIIARYFKIQGIGVS